MNGQPAYLPDGVVLVGWTHYGRSIRPSEFDKMSGVINDDNKNNNYYYYYFCYYYHTLLIRTLCCNVQVKLCDY